MSQDNQYSYLNTEQGKDYEAMLYQLSKSNPNLRKDGPIETDGGLANKSHAVKALDTIAGKANAGSREELEAALVLQYQKSYNAEHKDAKLPETGALDDKTRTAVAQSRTEHENANVAEGKRDIERVQMAIQTLQHDLNSNRAVFPAGTKDVKITGEMDAQTIAILEAVNTKNGHDPKDHDRAIKSIVDEVQGNAYMKQAGGMDMSGGQGLNVAMTGRMKDIAGQMDAKLAQYHKAHPPEPVVAKADPKVDPKADPKVDPKADPKVAKADPKVDPKADPKVDPKADPKVAKADPKAKSDKPALVYDAKVEQEQRLLAELKGVDLGGFKNHDGKGNDGFDGKRGDKTITAEAKARELLHVAKDGDLLAALQTNHQTLARNANGGQQQGNASVDELKQLAALEVDVVRKSTSVDEIHRAGEILAKLSDPEKQGRLTADQVRGELAHLQQVASEASGQQRPNTTVVSGGQQERGPVRT